MGLPETNDSLNNIQRDHEYQCSTRLGRQTHPLEPATAQRPPPLLCAAVGLEFRVLRSR